MIELTDITYSYGTTPVLEHAALHIREGESVALMGPNGSGKSTLLRLMNGLAFPQSGSYRFRGEEISEKSLHDRRFAAGFHQQIGYVFQNPDAQLFCSSVESEIAFAPRQMGLSEAEIAQRTEDCLQLLDLTALRARPPYALSGGEKRRTALACVLSMNPRVLMLDEPFNALDEDSRETVCVILEQLHAAGKTIVLSTHDASAAQRLCTRIVRLDRTHHLITEG